MPHKCTQCGREFRDGSTEILRGCPSCDGKKFLYVSERVRHKDVLEDKTIQEIALETNEPVLEVKTPEKKHADIYDRVESVRIVGPGSYELNIEKLAKSDERVIGVGKDGSYVVDLISMSKKKDRKIKR
ncbi:MAG: Zn-ribbon domain-containing protein [Methanocalculus sp.]|uniref:Zn-ribbon domain-containing protein n=1 Tax=Methanocalculus sp. TaxID=2004547 RepID=UPI002722B5EA|nr:Zn-ribbon domain-containing protein [Methanocalculus sp.]MDO9539887.1 Zn-ribbon domain-containing protein [Methanocalculus sp.]